MLEFMLSIACIKHQSSCKCFGFGTFFGERLQLRCSASQFAACLNAVSTFEFFCNTAPSAVSFATFAVFWSASACSDNMPEVLAIIASDN